MPDAECKKRWDKANVKMIAAKLFLTKEEDRMVWEYLQEQKSVADTIKTALREYMERHKD